MMFQGYDEKTYMNFVMEKQKNHIVFINTTAIQKLNDHVKLAFIPENIQSIKARLSARNNTKSSFINELNQNLLNELMSMFKNKTIIVPSNKFLDNYKHIILKGEYKV